MFSPLNILAQQSFDPIGNLSNASNLRFGLPGFENNTSGIPGIKDWVIAASYASDVAGSLKGNIYSLGMIKHISGHTFSARYTPGIQKDFIFKSGTLIRISDSLQELGTRYHFEEKFALGYGYNFHPKFTAGIILRYFHQEISKDQIRSSFSDSGSSFSTYEQLDSKNYWVGDLGITYSPFEELSLGLSSLNLVNNVEKSFSAEGTNNLFRTEKAILLKMDYQLTNNFNSHLKYESTGSFSAGLNFSAEMLGGQISAGVSAAHDKYQSPFINSVCPGLTFSYGNFCFSVSGVKYLNDRTKPALHQDFLSEGLHNIFHNRYSFDKVIFGINFALNTFSERTVKFVDVKITSDIYPTLSDNYLEVPFAIARVTNISKNTVTIKPSSFIAGINSEIVESPQITVAPKDTVAVPFYTIIAAEKELPGRTAIAQAAFYLSTNSSEAEDEIKKAVLVNDINSWDGNVQNLAYFVRKDIAFSQEVSKSILNKNKKALDSIPSILFNFYAAQLVFNQLVQGMIYVSDPRASADRVQFPRETLKIKGGDCDDLSVALASLLQSVGIQTAFVDFKSDSGTGHVNIMFNTGLKPSQAGLVTVNDSKYCLRKDADGNDQIWIPIEPTILTNFNEAWNAAAEMLYSRPLSEIKIIDIY